MNFLDGNLKNKTLSAEGFEIKDINTDFDGEVTLGIRPEHLNQTENGEIIIKSLLILSFCISNQGYQKLKNFLYDF